MFCLRLGVGCLLALLLVSCSEKKPSSAPKTSTTTSTNTTSYQVKGLIKAIHPKSKSIEIRHEEIPNFMPAMTMPFDVRDPKELTGLNTNDTVTFRLTVTDTDSWIDQIRKVEGTSLTEVPATNGFHFVRDVEPLKVGEALPEYHFTNQLGQTISTAQFKGQAVVISFIFTRCPLPNFCPRMSFNLQETETKLLADKSGPTNWHLITLTFDPEFDTPTILKSYAQRYHADPAHWSFCTGSLADISAISEQFGQTFWKDETGAINHNLRTAVIDSAGRIHQIIVGNEYTSDELAAAVREAAKK